MILHVTPHRNADELRRISKEIARGILGGNKQELAERLTGIAAGVLAYDGAKKKSLDILEQLQREFPEMSIDSPSVTAIAASRERLETFPGWDVLRDVETAPDSSTAFPVTAFPPPFCDYIASAAEQESISSADAAEILLELRELERELSTTNPERALWAWEKCRYRAAELLEERRRGKE